MGAATGACVGAAVICIGGGALRGAGAVAATAGGGGAGGAGRADVRDVPMGVGLSEIVVAADWGLAIADAAGGTLAVVSSLVPLLAPSNR
jgi:hypothetical protein